MNRSRRNVAKFSIPLSALCVLLVHTGPALAVVFTWNSFTSGNFDDPNRWFPFGVPGGNDFVRFEIPATLTVTFPGNDLFDPPAAYTTEHLRVRGHTITFSGSTQPLRSASTYTVDSPIMTEADRAIIIGELNGDVAVLNISDFGIACCGGLASLNSMAATIGDGAGAAGTLNVTNGGAFNVTGSDFTQTQLIVGNNGTGALNVFNGSDVNVPGTNSTTSLGHHSTGVGTVNISGAGSTWTNGNQLWVGENGTGTLTVQNGGSLVTSSTAGFSNIIGVFGGSHGTVTVTGPGSTWTNSNSLRVGNSGDGVLTIENGGSLIGSGGVSIGGGFSASGNATVTGPGSTWNTSSGILVEGFGTNGTGALAVLNGGSLTTGSALIRALNDGSGQVFVSGPGSTWTVTTGPLTIGLPEPGFTTAPTSLTINPGVSVNVTQDIDLNTNGTLNLQGGTLTTAEIGHNDGLILGQFQWPSGTLHVGLFRGSLTNQGGTLAPGLSAGRTTIDGHYTQQAAATLEIEIGGTTPETQHDFVYLEGSAILDGQLQLGLINNFVPSALQTFTIVDTLNPISGAFSNVANGLRLTTMDGNGSFQVNYGPGSAFDQNQIVLSAFVAVPLPGDYNHNGEVDAPDYVIWRNTVGQSGAGLDADGNGNNQVDNGDYNIWRAHFGQLLGSGQSTNAVASIPEPAALVLLVAGLAGVSLRRSVFAHFPPVSNHQSYCAASFRSVKPMP